MVRTGRKSRRADLVLLGARGERKGQSDREGESER